jgi:hypothetical protein
MARASDGKAWAKRPSTPAAFSLRGATMPIPNHRERQFMQQLRGRDWVKAFEFPESWRTIGHLLDKRWIESRGAGRELSFRITEEGLAAKKAPVPQPSR